MNFRDAWRESLAIYLLLLSDPGRILRFAGAPAVVLAVLGMAQMVPSDGPGGSLLMFLSLVGTVWGMGVWTVRWSRFLLLGEDGVQFWDMPYAARIWRTGGLLVSLLLMSVMVAILPASLVMAILAALFGPAASVQADPGDAAAVAATLPVWFHLVAVLVTVLLMIWPVARLAPALGSVVQDGRLVMGASWKATSRLLGLPPLVALLLVNLPLQLPGATLLLLGISGENLTLLLLGNILLTLTHPLVMATSALLWARIYGVAIGPYLSPRPVLEKD